MLARAHLNVPISKGKTFTVCSDDEWFTRKEARMRARSDQSAPREGNGSDGMAVGSVVRLRLLGRGGRGGGRFGGGSGSGGGFSVPLPSLASFQLFLLQRAPIIRFRKFQIAKEFRVHPFQRVVFVRRGPLNAIPVGLGTLVVRGVVFPLRHLV